MRDWKSLCEIEIHDARLEIVRREWKIEMRDWKSCFENIDCNLSIDQSNIDCILRISITGRTEIKALSHDKTIACNAACKRCNLCDSHLQRCMQRCRSRITTTFGTFQEALHATPAKPVTRSNSVVACNVACNVSLCDSALSMLKSKKNGGCWFRGSEGFSELPK